MKIKRWSRFLAAIMVTALLVALTSIGVFADEYEERITYRDKNESITLWSADSASNHESVEEAKKIGLVYDESSNTLTLNNVDIADLSIENMSEDFVLELEKINYIGTIGINADFKNVSVTMKGPGELTSRHVSFGMTGNYKSSLVINKDATFIVGDEDTYPASTIWADKAIDTTKVIQYKGFLDIPISFNEYGSPGEYILADAHVHTFSPSGKSNVNGIAKTTDGRWAMYKDGVIQTSYSGIVLNENGWWRVKDGYVDFSANGIYKNENGWWKTTNGKVTFKETGVFKNENGWWRVVNSKVDFGANGIYKNQNGWWKTTNGRVTFNENGVFKNENGWWKVKNSKVDFNFTGIASNKNGTWYLKNGKVDFSKTGKVTYNGKTYTVKNGKAQ